MEKVVGCGVGAAVTGVEGKRGSSTYARTHAARPVESGLQVDHGRNHVRESAYHAVGVLNPQRDVVEISHGTALAKCAEVAAILRGARIVLPSGVRREDKVGRLSCR